MARNEVQSTILTHKVLRRYAFLDVEGCGDDFSGTMLC